MIDLQLRNTACLFFHIVSVCDCHLVVVPFSSLCGLKTVLQKKIMARRIMSCLESLSTSPDRGIRYELMHHSASVSSQLGTGRRTAVIKLTVVISLLSNEPTLGFHNLSFVSVLSVLKKKNQASPA